MMTVASKELKNRLGKYLRLVKKGHAVEITDRGSPVACILPAVAPKQREAAQLLAALSAKGGLTLGSGQLGRTHKPVRLKPGPRVVEMISEERR